MVVFISNQLATLGDLEPEGLGRILVKEKKGRRNAHHALEKPGGGSSKMAVLWSGS